MKILSNSEMNNIRYLAAAILLAFLIMILTGTASAQVAPKGKRTEKLPQGTLKEAKVTARVITTVEEVGPMKVKLNVLNPTGKTVRISIRNYENTPVFEDSFREKEYNKILNFNSTVPGRYALHVTGPKQSETRRFAIDSKQRRDMAASELERQQNTDVMATIHKTAPTQIKLHMVNNTGKPVDYLIKNEAKETLYQGRVKDVQFSKLFDMSEVTDGKYTVEVQYLTDKTAARTFDMQTVYDRSFAWVDKRGRPLKPTNLTPISQKNND